MKTKQTLVILTLAWACMLSVVDSTHAFDGNRKGFMLGGGLGFAGTSFTQELQAPGLRFESDRENHGAIASDFKLGFGVSDRVAVYYFNRVSWFAIATGVKFNPRSIIASGTTGAGVSLYQRSLPPSWYVHGGLGLSTWDAPFDRTGNDAAAWKGFGGLVGVGFEYTPHWSIEASVAYGSPDESFGAIDIQSKSTSFLVTVSGLAY